MTAQLGAPAERVLVVGGWPAIDGQWDKNGTMTSRRSVARREIRLRDTVVTCCPPNPELVRKVFRALRPTWLILGRGLDDNEAESLISSCRAVSPGARLAMLGPLRDIHRVDRWMRRGCAVYLSDTCSLSRLLTVMNTAVRCDVQIVDHVFYLHWLESLPNLPRLTPRQVQVLDLLGRGYTNSEIGAELHVTEHTVEFHVRHLLQKLDARNRMEAVGRARGLGIS
jgi:DNA-binding NarL/FixJ family response regulator